MGCVLAALGMGLGQPERLAAVPATTPPAAQAAGARAGTQEDPSAERYREAREALSQGRYLEAAELLGRLAREYPASERAGDALYWTAYARYRLEDFERALDAVRRVIEAYPAAAERGDAEALRMRIEGALARRGDAEAARRVAEHAVRATSVQAQQARRQAEVAMRQAEVAATQARLGQRPRGRALQEGCDEADVQTAALNALLMMDSDRALPVLEKVLARRDECSEPLRTQATFLLGRHGGERGEDLLLQMIREDPSPHVRGQAVFWLSQIEGHRAVAILEEILAGDADSELQHNALFALSRQRSERAFEVLRAYALDDSKPDANRAQAIFWLSRHEAFGDLDALTELYARLPSEELKTHVLQAVAQNAGEPGAADWLVERVLDESEPVGVRKQALFWAGQAGIGIDRLDGLYDTLTDGEMKLQLVFVYSRSDDKAAVDRLVEIARTERDPEIRKQAIFWLGRSNDPRAAEFLVELLASP